VAAHQFVLESLSNLYKEGFEASQYRCDLAEKQYELGAFTEDALLLDGMGLHYIVKYIRRLSPELEGLVNFCVDFRRMRKRVADPERHERMLAQILLLLKSDPVLIGLTQDSEELEDEELMVGTHAAACGVIGGLASGFLQSEEGLAFSAQKSEESQIERHAHMAEMVEAQAAAAESEDLVARECDKVNLDAFDVQDTLGKGSYGTVLRVVHKKSNQEYALKVIQKGKMSAADAKKVYLREKSVLKAIGEHAFVVSCRHAFETPEKFYLALDFCSGGDLDYNLSQTRTGTFTQERATFYAAELTLALEHLHTNCILYRDMKPENVLLDGEGHVKLVDFGISRSVLTSPDKAAAGQEIAAGVLSHMPGERATARASPDKRGNRQRPAAFTFCGSPAYLSPEMVAKRGHGYEVDWFGMGALIYEMLVGLPPFYSENLNLMLRDIRWREPRMPSSLSASSKDLVCGLLRKNPADRLSSSGMRSHLFFESIDWELLSRREVQPPFVPPQRQKEGMMARFKNLFTKD